MTRRLGSDVKEKVENASAQLRRVLLALPKLDDDRAHSLSELATQVGTDERTLLNDLKTMVDRHGDEPGGFIDSVALTVDASTVRLEAPGFFRRPMGLTSMELRALELGLAMLKQETPPEDHDAIDSARDRLERVLAQSPALQPADDTHTAHMSVDEPSAHVMRELQECIRSRTVVEIEYQRPQDAATSVRQVRPIGLVYRRGKWYMAALSRDEDELRFFRLDRVVRCARTKERFARTDEAKLSDVLRDGRVLSSEAERTVRIRYRARIARWIAEREGATLDADGSVCVEHPLLDEEWAVRHVLQYGTEAEVEGPEEVRQRVRAALRRFE